MADPAAPDTPCPDFDLADLIELDPVALVPAQGDDSDLVATKELTLQLGLAFNDFKLLSWTQEQLEKGRPTKQGIVSPYMGQWAGMNISLNRLAGGLLWEITGVLRKHARLIDSSHAIRDAVELTAKSSPRAAKAWKTMIGIAHGQAKSHASLHSFYREIRNSFAFHYKSGGRALLAGLTEHFRPGQADPARAKAYVSLGDNMERTRFYFADAAAQNAVLAAQQRFGIGKDDTVNFARDVNLALRFVVGSLLVSLKALADGRSTSRRG